MPATEQENGNKIVDDILKVARAVHKQTTPAENGPTKITWSYGFVSVPNASIKEHYSAKQPMVVRLNFPKGSINVKKNGEVRKIGTEEFMNHLADQINDSGVLKIVKSGTHGQPRTNVFQDGNNWSIVIKAAGPDFSERNPALRALVDGLKATLDKKGHYTRADHWTDPNGKRDAYGHAEVRIPAKRKGFSDPFQDDPETQWVHDALMTPENRALLDRTAEAPLPKKTGVTFAERLGFGQKPPREEVDTGRVAPPEDAGTVLATTDPAHSPTAGSGSQRYTQTAEFEKDLAEFKALTGTEDSGPGGSPAEKRETPTPARGPSSARQRAKIAESDWASTSQGGGPSTRR